MDCREKLFNAILWDDISTLKNCFDYDFNINSVFVTRIGSGRYTALELAVEYKKIKIVKVLTSKGANPNVWVNNSPLILSLEKNQLELAKYLIHTGALINGQDEIGCTPLIKSLIVNPVNYQFVFELITSGADVNLLTCFGLSLIISIDQNYFRSFETLIRRGVDVNKCDEKGHYPIIRAVVVRNQQMVKRLLESGANLDVKDCDGDTAFIKSVRVMDFNMTKYIIEQKIDLDQKDAKDKSALEIALLNFDFRTFKLLMEFGADPGLASQSIQDMVKINPDFAMYIKTVQNARNNDLTKVLTGHEASST